MRHPFAPDGPSAAQDGAEDGADARGEISSLTGLRGVAAVYVVLFHFGGSSQLGTGPLPTVANHGYLAVDLFFVLSGFVMARTYGAGLARGWQPRAYGRFMARRAGRIYPLFLVATLVCALLSWVDAGFEGPLTARTLLANLLLVQAWGVSHSLDYPGWSISAEFAAYVLFPLLAAAVLSGRARAAAAAVLAVAGLAVLATCPAGALGELAGRLGPLDVWSASTPAPVLRCLCGFTLGMLAWRAAASPALRLLASCRGAEVAVAVAGLALLATRGSDVALVLLCAPLMVVLAARRDSAAARMLSWRPLHRLGLVSYSLYLVHYPVRWAVDPALLTCLSRVGMAHAGAAAAGIEILACIGLAELAHRWIERPGRDLLRALAAGGEERATSVLRPGVRDRARATGRPQGGLAANLASPTPEAAP